MKGNEIQKCALFAKLIGYKVFAIQNGGECLTSATAHKTYSKYGESQVCKDDGKGGPFANQVYRLSERKGILFYVLCCCCCFFLFLSWVFIVFIRNLDLVPSLHFLVNNSCGRRWQKFFWMGRKNKNGTTRLAHPVDNSILHDELIILSSGRVNRTVNFLYFLDIVTIKRSNDEKPYHHRWKT